jgi:hypothetical protein
VVLLHATHKPHHNTVNQTRRGKPQRTLLQDPNKEYTHENSFHVLQVQEVQSDIVVRVSYTTEDAVMPIFMLPPRMVEQLQRVWTTFDAVDNPCLLNKGINTLCCIADMAKRYQISKSYKDLVQYMCPNGRAHTAATIGIHTLYDATVENTNGSEVHTFVQNLLPGYGTTPTDSWVQLGQRDGEHGVHQVELVLSNEFMVQHSLWRRGGENITVYRFFVGVTFAKLQKTKNIHNSAALSVVTVFHNTTSNTVIANVVTEATDSSILDVGANVYVKNINGARHFFADVHMHTNTVLGLPERHINAESVRYVLGLERLGAPDDVSLSYDIDLWTRPCDNNVDLSTLPDTGLDPVCVPVYAEDLMSITVPVGVNIMDSSKLVLYIKMQTESSVVTAHIHLNDPGLYTQPPEVPADGGGGCIPCDVSFSYGLASDGFRDTLTSQPVPIPSEQRNNNRTALLSVVTSFDSTSLHHTDAFIGMNLDDVRLEDLYVFQFLGAASGETTLVSQRALVSATAASNSLKQAILLGKFFNPQDDPSHVLNPDINLLNELCDSTPTSMAPCRWTNPVADNEITKDASDSLFIYDSSASGSAHDPTQLKRVLALQAPEDADIINSFIDTPNGKLMFFHSTTTFNNPDASIESTPVVTICVALVSDSL